MRVPVVMVALLACAAADVATQVEISSQGQFQRPGMPPRDAAGAAAPQTGTARIRGRVTAADGSAPLRRAQVMIVSPENAVRRSTTTDGQGRYEFSELPAGRYLVTASKGGYVTLQAGQRRPFEPGNPMTLGDGQTLANVDVALPRGSVIAGRITDEFGEPIAMAQVQAQRYEYRPGGQRRLTFAGAPFVMTDDLGQFRVYGLMPGEYVISATVRGVGMAVAMGPGVANDTSEGFAPTFYPGTANPAEAQPIVVGVSQESTIHLALTAARMARVSGIAVDSLGKPAAGAMVMLRSGSADGMMSFGGAQVAADGSFTVAAVPPGDHVIDIRPQPRGPEARMEFASVPITVTGENITGLRVTTGPGATIRGRVIFDGSAPRTGNFGPLRVTPQNADPQQMPVAVMMGGPFAAGNGIIADDGTFELAGQAGNLLLRVNTGGTWMLKEVSIDGEDMTDVPYTIKGSETVSDVRIVLTDRLTELSGTVTDERGQPVKDYVVVLLPGELKDGVSPLRFTRTIRPDQEGVYRTRGLPPGAYVAAAVETVEQGGEWDPEFQRRVRDVARSLTVREGQTTTLDLKLAGGL